MKSRTLNFNTTLSKDGFITFNSITGGITYLPMTMEQKLSKIIERNEKLNKLAEVTTF